MSIKSGKALEDGEQSEEIENFTLLNADGSVEAVLDEKMDNLLITSEAKVKFYSNFSHWGRSEVIIIISLIILMLFRMIISLMRLEMHHKGIVLVVAL